MYPGLGKMGNVCMCVCQNSKQESSFRLGWGIWVSANSGPRKAPGSMVRIPLPRWHASSFWLWGDGHRLVGMQSAGEVPKWTSEQVDGSACVPAKGTLPSLDFRGRNAHLLCSREIRHSFFFSHGKISSPIKYRSRCVHSCQL